MIQGQTIRIDDRCIIEICIIELMEEDLTISVKQENKKLWVSKR